ncbi:hypothetical protein OSB04_005533 [Centaurea solstitialis]|uniref:Uncharacterized protein n=1 Tax=Centaurea solstitialis TaxID=347529 RepID=A0AA38TNU8_9ASTR|nr:hypothetical protein OSB04_005533 [Centaurea solstitialis]
MRHVIAYVMYAPSGDMFSLRGYGVSSCFGFSRREDSARGTHFPKGKGKELRLWVPHVQSPREEKERRYPRPHWAQTNPRQFWAETRLLKHAARGRSPRTAWENKYHNKLGFSNKATLKGKELTMMRYFLISIDEI